LDSHQLVEHLCYYQQVFRSRTLLHPPEIHLHNEKLLLGTVEVTFTQLYVLFLEECLNLTFGLKALFSRNPYALRIFHFFSLTEVQEDLKVTILKKLQIHLKNKRSKACTTINLLKDMTKALELKITYALTHSYLSTEDVIFWTKSGLAFESWKNALEYSAVFQKTLPIFHAHRTPWLLVIIKKMKEIESKNYSLLQSQNQQNLNFKIAKVTEWFSHPKRACFFSWLWPFLFNQNASADKRKFLCITGEPNTGKTFFVNNLLPCSVFTVKNMNFSWFASEKAGDYNLHALIFDDPGEAKGKNNQLDPYKFLDLANTTKSSHSFPVKYGFMTIKQGEVIIVSNQQASALFSADLSSAMSTRLLQLDFSDNAFPLKTITNETEPFRNFDCFFRDGNFEVDDPTVWEEAIQICSQKDCNSDATFVNQDVLFFILWFSILGIVKASAPFQSLANLAFNIPNSNLRKLVLENSTSSLYSLLCDKTDKELNDLCL